MFESFGIAAHECVEEWDRWNYQLRSVEEHRREVATCAAPF